QRATDQRQPAHHDDLFTARHHDTCTSARFAPHAYLSRRRRGGGGGGGSQGLTHCTIADAVTSAIAPNICCCCDHGQKPTPSRRRAGPSRTSPAPAPPS